jgi:CheY-like chemotaxis protein
LNGITGFAELLLQTTLNEEQRSWVELIAQCSEDILHLVNTILDFNKFRAEQVTLKDSCFSVEQLVQGLDFLNIVAKKKDLQMTVHVEPDVPHMICTDEHKLRQVLVNLIGNAIKFTDKGSISVWLRKERDARNGQIMLRFSVQDSGIGIKPEDIPKLFHEFVQVHGDQNISGTGLGLAISKYIVQLMGGTISVKSTFQKGSTFTFTINVMECTHKEHQTVEKTSHVIPENTSAIAATCPLHILVAEDNEINRKLIEKMLSKLGYTADFANDGVEVLEKVETTHYDIILMDIYMPRMGGLEATELLLKKLPLNLHPRVVALTASSWEQDKARYFAAGISEVLAKPITLSKLADTLKRTYNTKRT